MIRWLTAGESHGPALVATIEGLPAGIEVTSADIQNELARRRLGVGRGARQKFEQDEIEILGGIRHGLSIGAPIAIKINNSEWPKWQDVMSADPVDQKILDEQARNAPLTKPRPGHADLVGMQKYNFDDARPVLEILSHVVQLGTVKTPDGSIPTPGSLNKIDEDPARCFDAKTSELMQKEVESAHKDGDTLGGVVEVVVYGLPPGLGSYVHHDRRIDAKLAGALMGIQAIKGVEVGDGFTTAGRRGSQAHDEIVNTKDGVKRLTHRAGGTEGGMTTGEVLRVRAAMKPISTVPKALQTIDTSTGEASKAHNQRSDVCAVPAAGVIAEAMVALVLADALLEKFGGDAVSETKRNFENYISNLKVR